MPQVGAAKQGRPQWALELKQALCAGCSCPNASSACTHQHWPTVKHTQPPDLVWTGSHSMAGGSSAEKKQHPVASLQLPSCSTCTAPCPTCSRSTSTPRGMHATAVSPRRCSSWSRRMRSRVVSWDAPSTLRLTSTSPASATSPALHRAAARSGGARLNSVAHQPGACSLLCQDCPTESCPFLNA